MIDRHISAGCVAAWALWTATLVGMITSFLLPPGVGDDIGRLALVFCVIAALAQVRVYFVRHEMNMQTTFLLGRDVERAEVRRLPR